MWAVISYKSFCSNGGDMNKLTKIFAGVVLAGSTAMASAAPLYVNSGDNDSGVPFGDADGFTYTFDAFTFNDLQPVSTYLDLEGDGIQNGTLVFDSAVGEVGLLNPDTGSDEFFTDAWSLTFDYKLWGYAGISDDVVANGVFDDGEVLAAQFVGGFFNMYFDDDVTDGVDPVSAMTLSLTGSTFNAGGGVNLSLFAEIETVLANLFFLDPSFNGDSDLAAVVANNDPSQYGATITAEITDATQAPTDQGFAVTSFETDVLTSLGIDLDDYDNEVFLTRTTTLPSANLEIQVSSPASIAMMGLGLIGLAGLRRVKKA